MRPHRRGGVSTKIWGRKYTAEETTQDFFFETRGDLDETCAGVHCAMRL
jgi:hypothetical protein